MDPQIPPYFIGTFFPPGDPFDIKQPPQPESPQPPQEEKTFHALQELSLSSPTHSLPNYSLPPSYKKNSIEEKSSPPSLSPRYYSTPEAQLAHLERWKRAIEIEDNPQTYYTKREEHPIKPIAIDPVVESVFEQLELKKMNAEQKLEIQILLEDQLEESFQGDFSLYWKTLAYWVDYHGFPLSKLDLDIGEIYNLVPHLIHVDLRGNPFEEWPEEDLMDLISACKEARWLRVRSENLVTLSQIPEHLLELRCRGCTNLKELPYEQLKRLKVLNLEECPEIEISEKIYFAAKECTFSKR